MSTEAPGFDTYPSGYTSLTVTPVITDGAPAVSCAIDQKLFGPLASRSLAAKIVVAPAWVMFTV
jgi:hypothetical protein